MTKRLSDYKPLSDFNNAEKLERPVYIISMDEYVNKNGKCQVTLNIRDGKGTEKIAMFDTDLQTLSTAYPDLKPGNVVFLRITRKDQYYNADFYVKYDEDDIYDLDEIAEKATSNPERCYDYILNAVKEASDSRKEQLYDPLYKLVFDIYSEKREKLLKSSSAVSFHHTGLGGNILHTAEVVNLCQTLLGSVLGRDVDRELLLAGAALHDVGKLSSYATDNVGATTVTLEGNAYGGHHLQSILAVEEAEKRGNYDPERLLILKNIIASHHGSRDYGDIATPITIEGYWLHYMDDLDAKHYEAKNEIVKLAPGTVSSKKCAALDTYLYRRKDQ